ncbi:lipoprotein [Gordonia phage Morgana]|uniref:Lipoprotein n=1 Tax=Gordonia phage Morgana TaxID=3137292 RepID=A0AAX4RAP6_9CAUD
MKRLLPIIALAALIGACSSETAEPTAAPSAATSAAATSVVTSTVVETVTPAPASKNAHPLYAQMCAQLPMYQGFEGWISPGASDAEVADFIERSRAEADWPTDQAGQDAFGQAVRDYVAGECP